MARNGASPPASRSRASTTSWTRARCAGNCATASPGIRSRDPGAVPVRTLKHRTSAFIVHIPYRGASQIIPDVISGQVPIGVVSAAAGLAQAKAGKVQAIALMNTGTLPGAENVPSMAEALPGFDVAPRLMVLAPAGTPQALVDRLNAAMRSVMASPEVTQVAAAQGLIPAYVAPTALRTVMARGAADAGKVITAQKISGD